MNDSASRSLDGQSRWQSAGNEQHSALATRSTLRRPVKPGRRGPTCLAGCACAILKKKKEKRKKKKVYTSISNHGNDILCFVVSGLFTFTASAPQGRKRKRGRPPNDSPARAKWKPGFFFSAHFPVSSSTPFLSFFLFPEATEMISTAA